MAAAAEVTARPAGEDPVELSELYDAVFWSFPRSDQRRWAEAYVRGLIRVPGQKSIRRIADQVVGYRADQSLQQFLNQSPWPVAPIRRSLAQHLSDVLRPKAWVVEEVVFPRRGTNSVAVTQQYAASLGRAVNCQLGVAAMLAGDAGSCPVSWRLSMPKSWNHDAERRSQAHIPDRERHRPWWHYVLATIAEMAGNWGLPSVPVLIDARHDPHPEPLLRGLESRGIRYAVRVCDRAPARSGGSPRGSTVTGPGTARPPTAGEVAATMPVHGRLTVAWFDGARHRPDWSQIAVAPVPGDEDAARVPPCGGSRPTRRVVAEWPVGQSAARALWITNLTTARLPELVGLLRLGRQTSGVLRQLEESGLQHFKGRSFRGWHHHVTLVSVAHAYRLLQQIGIAERRVRPAGALGGRRVISDRLRNVSCDIGGRHDTAGSHMGTQAPCRAVQLPA